MTDFEWADGRQLPPSAVRGLAFPRVVDTGGEELFRLDEVQAVDYWSLLRAYRERYGREAGERIVAALAAGL